MADFLRANPHTTLPLHLPPLEANPTSRKVVIDALR
jgi:hypothetical protein